MSSSGVSYIRWEKLDGVFIVTALLERHRVVTMGGGGEKGGEGERTGKLEV